MPMVSSDPVCPYLGSDGSRATKREVITYLEGGRDTYRTKYDKYRIVCRFRQ